MTWKFKDTTSALFWIQCIQALKNKIFTRVVRRNFARLGARSTLSLPIRLGGTRDISIGDNVFIGPASWLEVLANRPQNNGPAISIGNDTSISGDCTITATLEVLIESSVLIGRFVHISDHSHNFASINTPIKRQGVAKIAPVRIKSGAWICQGSVICPGVTIGHNAVVAANSVVRHNVDDFCVVGGSPAKFIRNVATGEDRKNADVNCDPRA